MVGPQAVYARGLREWHGGACNGFRVSTLTLAQSRPRFTGSSQTVARRDTARKRTNTKRRLVWQRTTYTSGITLHITGGGGEGCFKCARVSGLGLVRPHVSAHRRWPGSQEGFRNACLAPGGGGGGGGASDIQAYHDTLRELLRDLKTLKRWSVMSKGTLQLIPN